MKKVPPCKDCDKRTPGCHTICTAYKEWKAEDLERWQARAKEMERMNLVFSDRVKKLTGKKLKERLKR